MAGTGAILTAAKARRRDRPAMVDLRPVAYVLGLLVVILGVAMLAPMVTDYVSGNGNGQAFLEAALICHLAGGLTAIACRSGLGDSLSIRQAFLLTFSIWVVLPLFGALPFIIGKPDVSLTDAYFEAVSGITTTGSSVFVGVDALPAGVNLWRGMLNWLGGLGIAFIAMIFLPLMRVGGMQFFRTEGFDTLGKIRPRAIDIARSLLWVYVALTASCGLSYGALGMSPLDATVHAMATIATGGFSPAAASFGKYAGPAEYAGAFFMVLGSLPFIRFVQMTGGSIRPLWQDAQARAYLRWIVYAVAAVVLFRLWREEGPAETILRQTLFNMISIFSGTGFSSADVAGWGPFAVMVAMLVGVIGGCSSSSSGALSVFRVQVMFASLAAHVRLIHSPHRVEQIKFAGRSLDDDVINPIILYATSYIFLIGLLSLILTLDGIDMQSAILAIWTSIGNIGFGFGAATLPTGTMVDFPTLSKWVMILAMVMGRLGLLSVLLLALPRFWRA